MKRKSMWMTVAAVVAVPFAVAFAGKLEDFQSADRSDGCDAIPNTGSYSSERSACRSQQSSVDEWCNGSRGPTSCGNESETPNLRKALVDVQIRIAGLKERKSKAESNKSNAKDDAEKRKYEDEIKQHDNDLYKANNDESAAKQALENRRKVVDTALYNIDQCIAYRKAVMNIFASALDRMRNESETPDIKNVAQSLAGKYEASKKGHLQQITFRENGRTLCKDALP